MVGSQRPLLVADGTATNLLEGRLETPIVLV